jgi:hypothetical protein
MLYNTYRLKVKKVHKKYSSFNHALDFLKIYARNKIFTSKIGLLYLFTAIVNLIWSY